MRYIGGISGVGTLKCDGEEVARVSYEFDGFYTEATGITRSGELRVSADALKSVFGRKDVQLLTDDGRIFDLTFSEKTLRPATDIAHVDATDDEAVPAASRSKWRH